MSTSIMIASTPARAGVWSTGLARPGLLLVIAAALAAGYLATGGTATAAAVAHDGAALTRLMRFMAALKGALALGATAAVFWRLGAAVTFPWFTAYALACAAMAAGPGLIWGMAHVGLGALFLHGGLLASILLLWRDPVVGNRLAALVDARRVALRS
jgi:hypothetical protein